MILLPYEILNIILEYLIDFEEIEKLRFITSVKLYTWYNRPMENSIYKIIEALAQEIEAINRQLENIYKFVLLTDLKYNNLQPLLNCAPICNIKEKMDKLENFLEIRRTQLKFFNLENNII